jgi:hypothetical protein
MVHKFAKMPRMRKLYALATKCKRCGRCCGHISKYSVSRGIEAKNKPVGEGKRCWYLSWSEKDGETIYSCKIRNAKKKDPTLVIMCDEPPFWNYAQGIECKSILELFDRLPPMTTEQKNALIRRFRNMRNKEVRKKTTL